MTDPLPVVHPPCATPACDCDHDPAHYPTGCDQGFEPGEIGGRARKCKRCQAFRTQRIAEKVAARQARKTVSPPKESL